MSVENGSDTTTLSDARSLELQRAEAVPCPTEVPLVMESRPTSGPPLNAYSASLHESADAMLKKTALREVLTASDSVPFTREEYCKILRENVLLRAKLDAETAETQEEIKRLSSKIRRCSFASVSELTVPQI
ncbi:conserved hypothetical protein [Neospora caninum Liverpool]|uniref:Uncharacterized protein n=1 Tax=Neospora caninum (strain Liverpool) TaxID=572307 RepID=F0VDP1_NEOCL|nr:conserved hypothetical protein [Neospora caninum Liverpool]CBZ51834.1 conserved hypothetical protein [Neospora caninum Liverpool]CEL65792.1 TPA: hypothetical protein BN1204_016260 [Neospora caninum Liverpool]|eukprot:XP_003881867.1 conserved hypothetical protein [Neospora caninum Liverpool]